MIFGNCVINYFVTPIALQWASMSRKKQTDPKVPVPLWRTWRESNQWDEAESMRCQWRLIIACCSLTMISHAAGKGRPGCLAIFYHSLLWYLKEYLNTKNISLFGKKQIHYVVFLSGFLRVNSKGFKQLPASVQLSFTCLSHTLASSLLRVRLMGSANWPTLNGISLSLQWFTRKAVWGLNSADGESSPIALCTWLRGDILDKLLKKRWSVCPMSSRKVNFQSYSQ